MSAHMKLRSSLQALLAIVSAVVFSAGLSGCLMVGWSSAGGGFIWPGGLGLLLVILLVLLVLRRR